MLVRHFDFSLQWENITGVGSFSFNTGLTTLQINYTSVLITFLPTTTTTILKDLYGI